MINSAVAAYLGWLLKRLRYAEKRMDLYQDTFLLESLQKSRKTEIGRSFDFKNIHSYSQFSRKVPIVEYDMIRDQIRRMMGGQSDVLAPGLVTWFSKSSGTTEDKSKFIPVTAEHLTHTHKRSSWYSLALLYDRHPDIRVFADRNLVFTGSLYKTDHPNIRYGDVSAIMLYHMPWIGKPFYTPDLKTSMMSEWDKKIEAMARICSKHQVGVMAGVPTWALVLMQRILELTGKANMHEVWPHAKAYFHGGVGFEPYEAQFRSLFPSKEFLFHEIYNASEGYFAAQDLSHRDEGLLLFPDTGIFYEFLPESEWNSTTPKAVPLRDIELDTEYAMVITTNGGLWRYKIGDTIRFTSRTPYRIRITGRTKQYINVFGEEVMVDNTNRAIAQAASICNASISDYTVAPFYLNLNGKGGHQWLVEFNQTPGDINRFADELDAQLQSLNSDYEAKRFKGLALERLRMTVLPKGTFRKWLERKGKSGSQAKIPRLSNDRKYVDDILSMLNSSFMTSETIDV